MRSRLVAFSTLSSLLLTTAGCAENQQAKDLLEQLQDDDYRATYARAPGWPDALMPSAGGPHGSHVDIYVNDILAEAIESGDQLTAWPDGSLIVKDGWNNAEGTDLKYVAAMEKRGDDWFWAEYDDADKVEFAGYNLKTCTNCHDAGDDQVLAFGFVE